MGRPQIRSSTKANTHGATRQYQSACRAVLKPQKSRKKDGCPKPAAGGHGHGRLKHSGLDCGSGWRESCASRHVCYGHAGSLNRAQESQARLQQERQRLHLPSTCARKKMRSPHVKKILRLLVPHVAADARALRLYTSAVNDASKTKFIACVWSVIHDNWSGPPHELCQINWFRDFVEHCGTQICIIPKSLATAHGARKAKCNSARNVKKRFGQSLGFTKRGHQSQSADFANIPETIVTTYSKSQAYPPLKHWMYETNAIKKKWKQHLTSGRRPDTRKPYLPMIKVNTNLIDHDVLPNESRRFRDRNGTLVCGVYRKFCPNEDVLPVVDSIVQENVSNRKNVRVSISFIFYNHY